MSDWDDDQPNAVPTPEVLCRRAFSRCSNWPEDREGQIGLAQALAEAERRFDVSQQEIIDECRGTSPFCPTDADIIRTASDMSDRRKAAAEAKRNMHAEWRKQYGDPSPGTGDKCSCCGLPWKVILKRAAARRRELWDGLRKHFEPKKGQWPAFREMAPVARELGFPAEADAWERDTA